MNSHIAKNIEIAFALVGGLVATCGSLLVLGWIVDHALVKWLRLTDSLKLFVRFAWLDNNIKEQMRADIAHEERERNKRHEWTPPADDDATDDDGEEEPTPVSEDTCHPTTTEVPLTTVETPMSIILEAAAAAYDADRFSLPFGSDEGILDSDKAEASGKESSFPDAPPAREVREISLIAIDTSEVVDACSLVILNHMIEYGYMMPSEDLRLQIALDLQRLLLDLKERTPRLHGRRG